MANPKRMTIADMIGKTAASITPAEKGSDELLFVMTDGTQFKFYHYQDCCECVLIDDVCGDLSDLIGAPLLTAEEVSDVSPPDTSEFAGSYTWTFYKFATIKGSVTVRWFGESNGYYSESVDLMVCHTGKEH